MVVVPEGVNTTFFDPSIYQPVSLPRGELVFGHRLSEDGGAEAVEAAPKEIKGSTKEPYRFMSAFKWEARKGWDVLLQAYLTGKRQLLAYSFYSNDMFLISKIMHPNAAIRPKTACRSIA